MAPVSYTCPYCKKTSVARSLQGLRSHISQSAKCRTRRNEEHAHLNRCRTAQDGTLHAHPQPAGHHIQRAESPEDDVTPPSDDHTDAHQSKRARVDDADDEDNDNGDENFQPTNVNFIVDYPEDARAGGILEDTNDGLKTRFDKIRHMQRVAGKPAWVPFSDLADWELSRWLVQLGVSQREIDKFLKLESVRTGIANSSGFTTLNVCQDPIWCSSTCPKQTRVLQED